MEQLHVKRMDSAKSFFAFLLRYTGGREGRMLQLEVTNVRRYTGRRKLKTGPDSSVGVGQHILSSTYPLNKKKILSATY
jgi:hypothetical protein